MTCEPGKRLGPRGSMCGRGVTEAQGVVASLVAVQVCAVTPFRGDNAKQAEKEKGSDQETLSTKVRPDSQAEVSTMHRLWKHVPGLLHGVRSHSRREGLQRPKVVALQ